MPFPILEEIERPQLPPVAPKWVGTVVLFMYAVVVSFFLFNYGG